MSLYSLKAVQGGIQPWINTLAVGKGIFDYYDPLGDVTSMSAMSVPSFLDGPGAVVRYNNLTLSHLLTTTNRCRSLTVLVDGNLTINSGGGISMTARGARGHAGYGLYDVYIPNELVLSSKVMSLDDVLLYIRKNGIDIADRWFWDEWSKYVGVSAVFSQGTALALMLASGCGAGGSGQYAISYGTYAAGLGGSAGTSGGTGGGGGGGSCYSGVVSSAPSGCPWGGGAGSGGLAQYYPAHGADMYGGVGGAHGGQGGNAAGGGAGNPGGAGSAGGSTNGRMGTGGRLTVIVKGNITINTGGLIQADGSQGGDAPGTNTSAPGAGSGGGHVSLIYGGTYTNNGTVRANGGPPGSAGVNSAAGGAGGAGSVVTKTFTQMGW